MSAGLQAPEAFMHEAVELIEHLDPTDLGAFRLRFGDGVLDLVLDAGERAVRAIAARLSIDRAVREKIRVHELEHLDVHPRRCEHVREGEHGTLDLFHGTAYCALCEDEFTGARSPIAYPAGLLQLPGQTPPDDPDEIVLLEDHWCHTCGRESQSLAWLTFDLPSGDSVSGQFCPDCAPWIAGLPDV